MNILFDSANGADMLIYLAYEEEPFPLRLGEAHKQSGSVTWLYARSEEESDVLAVGMGKRKALTLEKIRRAAGSAARLALREGLNFASLFVGQQKVIFPLRMSCKHGLKAGFSDYIVSKPIVALLK